MKKTGIIICSRTDSTRIPKKVFANVNGTTLIEHLLRRLEKTKLPIVIAVPNGQGDEYSFGQQIQERQNLPRRV